MNLKKKEGMEVVKKLCQTADVLVEPFRPGEFIFRKETKHAVEKHYIKRMKQFFSNGKFSIFKNSI